MKKLFLIAMLMIVSVPVSVLAQEGEGLPQPTGTIAIGESVQGTITDEQYEVFYAFSAEAGEVIYISAGVLGNSYLSMELEVLDSLGAVVLEEEFYLPISVLGPFEVLASGDYLIHLQRYNGAEGTGSGNFALTVDYAELAPLELNAPVTGTLPSAASTQFWSFQGAADELLSIQALGDGLEFVLVDPNGWYIAAEGPFTDPREYFLLLNQDGEYRLMLRTEQLGGAAYELSVTSQEPVELTLGTVVDSGFAAGELADYYVINAAPNKLLRLEIATDDPDFWAQLHVYDADGYIEEYTSGSAEDAFELLIEPWIVSDEGDFYIVVSPFEFTDTERPYSILVRESDLLPLELNETTTATLDGENGEYGYAVRGFADQHVSVDLRQVSGDCTPELAAQNRDGSGFALWQNVWSHAYSVEIIFPQDDFYVFLIEKGSYSDECEFEFAVNVIE